VINLSEYETMRMMMLLKNKEKKLAAEMKQRRVERRHKAEKRKDLLEDGSADDIADQYVDLRKRILEVSPPSTQQQRDDVEDAMSRAAIERDLDRHGVRGNATPALYDRALDTLLQLHSNERYDDDSSLERQAADLRQSDRATHADWLSLLHRAIDRLLDDLDDRINAFKRIQQHGSGGSSSADHGGAKGDDDDDDDGCK